MPGALLGPVVILGEIDNKQVILKSATGMIKQSYANDWEKRVQTEWSQKVFL